METIPRRHLTKRRKQLLQAKDKLYDGIQLPKKALDLPLDTEIIRQAHGLMMEDEKMSWWGNIKGHLHFQAIKFLHRPAILKIHERHNF